MKVNAYRIVEECLERGAAYGYNRAYKHDDDPPSERITEEIVRAQMTELCEYIRFEDMDIVEEEDEGQE